ncbi:N-acetyl-gamma-glutamyl-phosphate reductase [Sphingomonas canadensis]|uniref:N-acetyl-gamma-glutamyl-phosphate reductase n=1 Tax=Sphingomonas canadensis TaxID=1219257 RepID=A0ABW3H6W5_9SPHN|nr:N-acetyl-gamma-glutamyl-phosphate reductase [Sphingomonas canadensis]MCW3836678.1 N-acetyl-gamma-glutamyl-phosphate reductase [Sphingomonas canadensis]
MTARVFIDGAAGTTGLEIRERLAARTDIELLLLPENLRKNSVKRREALNGSDFVILCLPDDAAREAVALIENPEVRVIDASTAFRTGEGWTYGLPELEPSQPKAIAEARFVSNPGCWPTGFLALVRPLVRMGLVPHDWPLVYSGASGYSGGGKAMIAEFEDEKAKGHEKSAYRAYGLGMAHKHLPEMHKHARIATPPLFLPAVARTYRGMLSEVALPLHALPRKPSLTTIETTLREAYKDSPVVSVMPAEDISQVRIEENAGTDRLWIRVFGNAETGQARLMATYDNLGKGAGGAAVQNLNLMAGLDPTAGLVL